MLRPCCLAGECGEEPGGGGRQGAHHGRPDPGANARECPAHKAGASTGRKVSFAISLTPASCTTSLHAPLSLDASTNPALLHALATVQTAVTILQRGEALYPVHGLQGFPDNYPMLITGDAQVRFCRWSALPWPW